MRRPAALGGEPAFAEPLPFARPATPSLDAVAARVRPSWERGMLTNGELVKELEARAAEFLGVEHVIAVSSCTAGLMLALKALGASGPIVMPSFTFSATAHAAAWNGCPPVFSECVPASLQIDVADAAQRLGALTEPPAALMATHVFGAPCDAGAVEALGNQFGIPVVFDAAHGFGATHGDRKVGGLGRVEVFSMSPTKVLVSGEGGLVATNDAELAAQIAIGRDYGNPGDYNTQFAGLNARLSEVHAAIALESFAALRESTEARQHTVRRYLDGLDGVPGVEPQLVPDSDTSTYKDFTVRIVADAFGTGRDVVVEALKAEGIDTRLYFYPPVHRQASYTHVASYLPITDQAASEVVSLPVYPVSDDAVEAVVAALETIQAHAAELDSSREAFAARA